MMTPGLAGSSVYWTIAVRWGRLSLFSSTCMDLGVSYEGRGGCTGLLRPCGAGSPLSPLPVGVMGSVMRGGQGVLDYSGHAGGAGSPLSPLLYLYGSWGQLCMGGRVYWAIAAMWGRLSLISSTCMDHVVSYGGGEGRL